MPNGDFTVIIMSVNSKVDIEKDLFLSAVILNYNSYKLTVENVNTLLNIYPKINIIIVDNNSSDQSWSVLTSSFAQFSNVYCIQTKKNNGYATGNNYGMRFIQEELKNTKYVAIINPDIKINNKNLFYEIVEFMEKNKDIAVTGALTLYNDQFRGLYDFGWKLPSKRFLKWAGTFLGKLLLSDVNDKYTTVNVNNNGFAEVEVVPGCFFIGKIDILESIGYFDEDTFLYFEETILAKKLSKIGKKEAIYLGGYIEHNHKTRDNELNNYKKKLFDRKCFYSSKMHYIKCYSNLKKNSEYEIIVINFIDILLKKIIYHILSVIRR